jgi:hypothetical protein
MVLGRCGCVGCGRCVDRAGPLVRGRPCRQFPPGPDSGDLELALPEPGNYVIYYEGPGASQGVVLSAFDLTLTPTDGKQPVALSKYAGSLTYSIGGRAGFAVFTFEINEPRSFLLTLTYGGEGPLPSQVAVGTSIASFILGTAVGGVAWFLLSFIIALVVFLRRRRARRATPGTSEPGGS